MNRLPSNPTKYTPTRTLLSSWSYRQYSVSTSLPILQRAAMKDIAVQQHLSSTPSQAPACTNNSTAETVLTRTEHGRDKNPGVTAEHTPSIAQQRSKVGGWLDVLAKFLTPHPINANVYNNTARQHIILLPALLCSFHHFNFFIITPSHACHSKRPTPYIRTAPMVAQKMSQKTPPRHQRTGRRHARKANQQRPIDRSRDRTTQFPISFRPQAPTRLPIPAISQYIFSALL